MKCTNCGAPREAVCSFCGAISGPSVIVTTAWPAEAKLNARPYADRENPAGLLRQIARKSTP